MLCQWPGAMHPLWFLEEGRINGEDGDQDPIHEKEVWGRGRTECFVQIIRGDMLLGGLRQLVVVWGIVACSVALGSRYRDGSIVIYRRHEMGVFGEG